MSIDLKERQLNAKNLPVLADQPETLPEVHPYRQAAAIDGTAANGTRASEPLAALFVPAAAGTFRTDWDAVQSGFVDDPRQAVRRADELVNQVMTHLAETFSAERAKLEGEVDPSGKPSTEDLRVALRRYRSFFERLLSL